MNFNIELLTFVKLEWVQNKNQKHRFLKTKDNNIMKKLLFTIALGVFLFMGCSSIAKEKKVDDSTKNIADNETNAEEGGTEKLTKERFIKEVWNFNDSPEEWKYLGDKPAIIDFYADWCGPCRTASPILEEVSNEYAGKIHVYKIDTQKERELAGIFGIQSIPAFLYIPAEGKPVMIAGIGRSNEETKEMFVSNIKKYLLKE